MFRVLAPDLIHCTIFLWEGAVNELEISFDFCSIKFCSIKPMHYGAAAMGRW